MMKTAFVASVLVGVVASANAAVAAPKTFSLKTTSSDPKFNNLCGTGYHTGAGTDDVTLTRCSEETKIFYLNGTNIKSTLFPDNTAAFYAQVGATYDSWYPTVIGTGLGQEFQYSAKGGFTASGNTFLACEWAHGGLPQLFILAENAKDVKIIDTCAEVILKKAF